jgi:hypothetical protein
MLTTLPRPGFRRENGLAAERDQQRCRLPSESGITSDSKQVPTMIGPQVCPQWLFDNFEYIVLRILSVWHMYQNMSGKK